MGTRWHINGAGLVFLISIGLIMASLSAAEEEAKIEGLIEIDYPQAGEAKVEVNLLGGVFSLAAKLMEREEPETSEFLANLEAVKVRVYDKASLGERNPDEVLKFYEKQLKKEKWEVLAHVRDKDSNVGVYLLTDGDIISGLVVLIRNPKEFIIANLAGNIDVTKLSQIDKVTGVKLGLSDLNFRERSYKREVEIAEQEML